jgi:hypothetical protein
MSGKAGKTSAEAQARADKKIDKAGNMSFLASDPTAHGAGTEAPSRPRDRKAPKITKEQIEQRSQFTCYRPSAGSGEFDAKQISA